MLIEYVTSCIQILWKCSYKNDGIIWEFQIPNFGSHSFNFVWYSMEILGRFLGDLRVTQRVFWEDKSFGIEKTHLGKSFPIIR